MQWETSEKSLMKTRKWKSSSSDMDFKNIFSACLFPVFIEFDWKFKLVLFYKWLILNYIFQKLADYKPVFP